MLALREGQLVSGGASMNRADQYRHLEAEVRARASNETSPTLKAEWENLAQTYARLAEQSEASSDYSSVIYDPLKENGD